MKFKRPTAKRAGSARSKGKGKRKQTGPLVSSCAFGASGVILDVRARKRGATLRSVVGPRLVVGLHRASTGAETGSVSATFTKP